MEPFKPICILILHLVFNPPTPSTASNILFFHLLATSSHRTSIWPLAQELAERGHKITYIFPAENRDGSHPNIEDIAPSKMLPLIASVCGDFDINIRINNTIDEWTWQLFSKSVDVCEAFYDSPEVIEWLARPNLKYDLVFIDVVFGECVYGLVHRFKAKHILLATVLPTWIYDGFGIVPETSSIPEIYFHRKPSQMGLTGRLVTTLSPLIFRLNYLGYMNKIEPIMKAKLILPEMPSLVEIEKNTSLVFYNGYFVEDYPMSLPPVIVSYSGLWCSKKQLKSIGKSLPKDITEFISKGEQGFIYVSFGSSVVVSDMPEEISEKFFKTFAAFPKIQFLWRWTGPEPKYKPENVMFKKWYPQRDILANGKIRGFITQGGRPSTQEAFCFGVPMISFPIFADQNANANRLEQLGVSITFEIDDFTESDLQNAIKDLLENPTYTNKMKELSTIFRDRPVDPLESVMYWTEYALRHNTSLLKPLAISQTWWQRRLLDVYAVLLLFIGLIILICMFILKALCRLLFIRKVKNE